MNPARIVCFGFSLALGVAWTSSAVAQTMTAPSAPIARESDDPPSDAASDDAVPAPSDDPLETPTALVHPAREGVRVALFQRFVALLNPMGMEHTFAVGLRAPIGDQDELLFDGAHFGGGLIEYLSPIYTIQGGYVRVSPLSFLVFHAELTQTTLWPIGMSGAGYYGLDSYDSDVRPQALPAESGDTAIGWSFAFRTVLQGRLELGGPVALMMASELAVQYDDTGDAPFYYSMKHDLVLAQRDWLLLNDAAINVEIRLVPDVVLSVGAFDNVRFVPASGYVAHQVGPIVSVTFEEVTSEVEDLTIWVRGGYYTDHVVRADELTILGGVSLHYDVGGL